MDFNPLSPHGERRHEGDPVPGLSGHFNPLSPHGERPSCSRPSGRWRRISIHSPRMGRDPAGAGAVCRGGNFNPLSPHGERRKLRTTSSRATYFNPLSPHGERPGPRGPHLCRVSISIHSPRMGRDSKRTQLFEEKNWRICTTLYLFASKGVLPADKKTF